MKRISVWSKTFDPSSVFLQLVRLKRLSSMMKTFFSAVIRQTFDVVIYDICSKKRSETEPVCLCRIKETVERVLGKCFLKRVGLLLHIHTSSDKNVTEFVTKQRNRRNAFFFHAITSGKKLADMVFRKKSLNAVN